MIYTVRHGFGDVVLVPFPFTDQSGAKKRPAVVVSSLSYGASRRDIVIMAITGQLRSPVGFGEALVADWRSAGLIKASLFKPIFTTIEAGLVLHALGKLAEPDIKSLRGLLAQVIG
jgi:mRNA interferase MazF